MKNNMYWKYYLLHLSILVFMSQGKGYSCSIEVHDSIHTRIDTHIHLYDTRRPGSSVFLDPVNHKKIYFPHLAQQFVDTASQAGVGYAIVVEASMRREDNFWLLAHVDTADALLAFIGNLDPRDPMFVKDLDSLSKSKKFRGIRIRPSTPINLADTKVIESFVELARRNLVLELGGNGYDPQIVAAIARRFPNMHIIMNHLAGGALAGTQINPGDWKARLAVFASEPNVYCKISALFEASGKNPAPINSDFYDKLIDPVVNAFGYDRVIFGSNWPLSDMLGSYEVMVKMLDDYCTRHPALSPEKLFYENINKAYDINRKEMISPDNGNGLIKTYWNGKMGGSQWFVDSLCSQIDPAIDDSWGIGSPACGASTIFWNARWVGFLKPLFSGNHTFYLTVNDFGRVWIDDKLIIDKWIGGSGNACYTGSAELIAGQQVPIKVEFANLVDNGFIRLEWESAGLPREVIPVSQFFSPIFTGSNRKYGNEKSFSVVPNPAVSGIIITSDNHILDEIRIINIEGKTRYQSKGNAAELQIDVSSWPSGLYFVEALIQNKRVRKKIIVEN